MEVREVANYATSTAVMPLPLLEQERLSDKVLAIVDRHRHVLFLALFGTYLLGFNGQWRVEPDSALYLTLARNLSQGLGYSYRGIHHHLAYPGLPLMFAGVFKLLHTQSVVPLLVLMMLTAWAGLGLAYRLFLLYSDRPTAVMVTLGLGMTRLFYRYSFELLSDMPFLVAVLAFLVGYESVFFARRRDPNHEPRWFDWVFLVGGLMMAMSMRPVMLPLLGAIAIAVTWSALVGELPRRWAIIIPLAMAVAAIFFFALVRHHQGSASVGGYEDYLLNEKFAKPMTLLRQIFKDNIPSLFESSAMKALFGAPVFVGLNSLLSLVTIGLAFWLVTQRKLWGVWAIVTVLMLCLFKPLDRYFLPVVPLLVFAWWAVLARVNHRLPYRWADKVFLALLIFGGTTNLLRLGQMVVFEQRRVPFIEHYREGCYASLAGVGELLDRQVGSKDWVLVEPKCARILTYVSGRYAIEKGDNVLLGRKQPAFALEGTFEESHTASGETVHESTLETELHKRHLRLGPQVGETIQGPTDRQPWVLRRVERLN
jgi:hypothetical protein